MIIEASYENTKGWIRYGGINQRPSWVRREMANLYPTENIVLYSVLLT
jgi:hypothetical protein